MAKKPRKILSHCRKNFCEKTIKIDAALSEPEVLKKVPADAKEDWVGLVETLQSIAELTATATPSKVVDEAINGWYHEYLHATYENWPRREEDLESLVDFASKYENLSRNAYPINPA